MPSPRAHLLCLSVLVACGGDPAADGEDRAAPARGDLDPRAVVAPPAPAPRVLGPQVHPDDPEGWVPIDEFEGAPVDVLRVFQAGGGLRRIACYHRGHVGAPDQRHGPEWSYFKNGFLRETLVFRDGVAHGPFRNAFQNGQTRSQGEKVDGVRHGVFHQWFENGDLQMEHFFEHGKPTGHWRDWYVGLFPKVEAHYVDGLLHGELRAWDKPGLDPSGEAAAEGVLTAVEHYEHGRLHGPWADYDPQTGTPRTQGRYEAGERVGAWTVSCPTGQVVDEFQYLDGRRHGPQVRRSPEGQLIEELTWEHGLKTGPARQYHASGELQAEGSLRDGLRHGPWTYYQPDGSIDETWSGTYEDDDRVDHLPDQP